MPRAGSAPGRRAGWRELAALRLRLGLRRLRSPRGVADGVAQLVLLLVAIPAGLAFATFVALGTHRAVRAGHGLIPAVSLGAIFFGLWQAWTAVSLTVAERDALDLRRLLVYPIPPGRLYAAGLTASLLGDPFSLFWLLLLAGVPAGALAARPGPWVIALGALVLLFASATVALIALLHELLARAARARFARELLAVAGVVGWLGLIVAGSSGRGVARPALHGLARLRWVLYPPALATEGARALLDGAASRALGWMAALALATGAAGWAAYRLALAGATSGGEVAGGRPRSRPPRLPRLMGPALEKELRYLARHPATRVYLLLLPALAAIVAWRAPAAVAGDDLEELLHALPVFGIAAYTHLVLQTFWANGLGLERGGVRTIFLAPLAPERWLAAKNLALLALSLLVYAAGVGAYALVAGPPPPWVMLGGLTLELGLAPVLYGLGNALGAVAPWAAPFGMGRAGAQSALSALLATAVTSGALAVFAAPVLVGVWLDRVAIVPWAWAALAGAAWLGWWITLPAAGRLVLRRRESIVAAVCGDVV